MNQILKITFIFPKNAENIYNMSEISPQKGLKDFNKNNNTIYIIIIIIKNNNNNNNNLKRWRVEDKPPNFVYRIFI